MYKRQQSGELVIILGDKIYFRGKFFKSLRFRIMLLLIVIGIIPVSYTHLDVYKRQVKWDQKIVKQGGAVQAIIVNSGIANACTGEEGKMCIRDRFHPPYHFYRNENFSF